MVTTAYGQNDLSDEKVKQNIRDADLEELQAIFDRAAPKRYDRADTDQKDRLGFLAHHGKLTAVLWGVCKRLQARVEALEKPKKAKAKSRPSH